MLTIMDEEVLELCTITVTRTPITSPATGFESTESSLNMSPAALPIKKNPIFSEVREVQGEVHINYQCLIKDHSAV